MDTETLFDLATNECKDVFLAKFREYGSSWRLLRVSALCDRIFTKAARIRRLEGLGGVGKVEDSIDSEFIGIVNYSILVLDRLGNEGLSWPNLDSPVPKRWDNPDDAARSYGQIVDRARELLMAKNYDYNEAWRHILLTTFTDEILSRTLRVRELMSAESVDAASLDGQLIDVLNYSVLALVRIRQDIQLSPQMLQVPTAPPSPDRT